MTLTGCWTEENRRALEEMLGREHKHLPIAVLDWDGTCMQGDIAEVIYHQLCEELGFRFETPGFWDWITEPVPTNTICAAYQDYCAHPTAENKLRLRIHFERLRQSLYEGEDDGAICAWETGILIGWTLAEARQYARQVFARELIRLPRCETLALDGEKLEFKRELRLRAEMQELIRTMQNAGWDVWVISASAQWLVEVAAEWYGIPPSRVVGMRRQIVDGRISGTVLPPISFSDGKLDAYQTFVNRTRPPTFAAGDSLYDWKLLEWADEARLLVEPVPDKLRDFAHWRRSEGETWLFQLFS
jgi:phosphoserine phosphatase